MSARRAGHSGRDARGALLHPAFLGALVLLVVNDQLLKGAHLLPGAVTGKLSDVAGLVVAPIALAALVRARSRRAQLAVHALVAGVFALTELSQSTADLLAHALRTIGVARATLVADPSDLWALAVLPLPYALVRRASAPIARAAPRVSLALALLACVASPQPPPPSWRTSAYLVNGTGSAVDVRIAWTTAQLDCAALSAPLPSGLTLSRVVDPAIFGDAITFHLEHGSTVPIDEAGARAAVGPVRSAPGDGGRRDGSVSRDAGAGPLTTCQLVLLRAEGVPDRIVLVPPTAAFSVGIQVSELPSPERAVQLLSTSGVPSWVVGSALPSDETTGTNAPTTCTSARPSMAFSEPVSRTATLTALDVGADGCVDAQLDTSSGSPLHLFLCGIPVAMIPFAVGDVVDVTANDAQHLAVMGHGTTARLTVAGPLPAPLSVGSTQVTAGAAEACNGERDPCGAFVIPLAFTLSPTVAGDDPSGIVTHVDTSGTTQLLVGTSEHVLIALPGCSSGRSSAGPHAQLAVAHSGP